MTEGVLHAATPPSRLRRQPPPGGGLIRAKFIDCYKTDDKNIGLPARRRYLELLICSVVRIISLILGHTLPARTRRRGASSRPGAAAPRAS